MLNFHFHLKKERKLNVLFDNNVSFSFLFSIVCLFNFCIFSPTSPIGRRQRSPAGVFSLLLQIWQGLATTGRVTPLAFDCEIDTEVGEGK